MRRLLNVTICVAAFVASCGVIHALLPLPELGNVNLKLRFLAAHRDEFDTVFIGSSRTFHGVSPAVFDKASAVAGRRHRSFNFGVDGMWPPEQFYVLDQILKLRPRKWRWVLIELDDVQIDLPPEVKGTQRAVYWHDGARTWMIFRKLLRVDTNVSLLRICRRAWRWRRPLAIHARLLLQNYGNVGRAVSRFSDAAATAREIETGGYLGPNSDGYIPVELQLSGPRADVYEQWLQHEISLGRHHTLDPIAEEIYRGYAARFRGFGATTAFFVTPGSASQLPSRFGRSPAPLFFAFNDPEKFPALYESAARWNENHLNQFGAVRFSELFAQTFAATTAQ